MTEIIGVDHSKPILDRVISRLQEKGVIYQGHDGSDHKFIGMGNKRLATLTIPQLDYTPTNEQADELYSNWINDVERQLRNPGKVDNERP